MVAVRPIVLELYLQQQLELPAWVEHSNRLVVYWPVEVPVHWALEVEPAYLVVDCS